MRRRRRRQPRAKIDRATQTALPIGTQAPLQPRRLWCACPPSCVNLIGVQVGNTTLPPLEGRPAPPPANKLKSGIRWSDVTVQYFLDMYRWHKRHDPDISLYNISIDIDRYVRGSRTVL